MSSRDLAARYFEAFNAHDCAALAQILDVDIQLVDWEVSLKGRGPVLEQMQALFVNAPDIHADIGGLIAETNRVAAELTVTVGDNPPLRVVDILTFGEDSRLTSITAYKI